MSKKVYFKGVNLIKGNGEAPIENTGLLVENDTIKRIGNINNVKMDEDVKVIDLDGKYIMPGMINCHVHIMLEPIGDPISILKQQSTVQNTIMTINNLQKHLKSGVTFLRDLGGYNHIDLELKKCVDEGLIEGPNFLASGKLLTMTGGHGWQFGRECDGRDEVRKAAREQLKAGVDVIKIMATGGVMTPGVEPGSPQLTKEELEVAIQEAHKAGKRTASHAQGTTGIKNAILAGIDSIEHGIFLTDEIIELMIEKDVYLVPTLAAPYFIVEHGIDGGIPKFAVEKSKRVMNSHLESFRKAKEAGVKIAMGTDAGTPFNLHDKSGYELKLMVEGGMTPMEAIVSSTKTAAELLGVDKNYGTLEEEKIADFIVLKENPLNNIETVLNIECVYKNGKLV